MCKSEIFLKNFTLFYNNKVCFYSFLANRRLIVIASQDQRDIYQLKIYLVLLSFIALLRTRQYIIQDTQLNGSELTYKKYKL